MRPVLYVVVAIAALLSGCSRLKSAPEAPDGLTCADIVAGGDDGAALERAFGAATAGSCVVVGQGPYQGSFVVPPGVMVTGTKGARATFRGDGSSAPVLSLTGAPGSGLATLDVFASAGIGVAVHGGPVVLKDVSVQQAGAAGVAVVCKENCADAGAAVSLSDVRLQQSVLGLWVSGATLDMNRGISSGHRSGGHLSGGAGIVALAGARLSVVGASIDDNEGVGVLADGASTVVQLRDVHVGNNGDRGVWVQNLAGTSNAPALTIVGDATVIEKNHVAGVGAIRSRGIVVSGGVLRGTVQSTVVTDISGSGEPVGDGLGLFASTGVVHVLNTRFEANDRAAGLIDAPADAIVVEGASVVPGVRNLQFVVQNNGSSANVTIPSALVSTSGGPLGVSAPELSVMSDLLK